MTVNECDASIFQRFPRLHDKVFLYDYVASSFLLDAREVREMPFAKQQISLNHSAAKFLEQCDGTKRLDQYIKDFVQNGHYCIEDKDKILQFVLNAIEKGHIVMESEARLHAMNLFSLQGSRSGFPAHLSLELTYKCNLTCKHCYCGDYTRYNYVEAAALLRQLDIFVKNGTAVVELTGGEPLLHPNFSEILGYCLKHFLIVAVISNGTLFTDEIIEILANYRHKVVISISLDGPCAEIHDHIRGMQGAFAKTVSTVRMLRKCDIKVRMATVISKHNFCHVYEMAKLGKELGVNWIAQTFLIPVGKGKEPENLLTIEEFQQAIEAYQRTQRDFTGYYLELEGQQLEELHKRNCGAGWRTMAISPKGNIKPCVMADEDAVMLGNIFTENLYDIFARNFAQYFCRLSTPQEEICGNCKHLYFCQFCVVRPLYKIKEIGDECLWNKSCQYQKKLAAYRQQVYQIGACYEP